MQPSSEAVFELTRRASTVLDACLESTDRRRLLLANLSSPIRLGQVSFADADRPGGLAAWAYVSVASFRLYTAGKQCLLDVGDWNEGSLLLITHWFAVDLPAGLALRSAVLADHSGERTVAWVRRYSDGRRRLRIQGDAHEYMEGVQ